MKKIFASFIIIILSLSLIACAKEDYELSNHVFEEYQNELEKFGYDLNLVDATNNISGWLEITDEDVVNIHRTTGEDGVLYMYLFPTINKAEKWYDKMKEKTTATNYKVFLDGHYVVVVLGNKLYDIAESLSS